MTTNAPAPDPRDAEIAALRGRVAELEADIASRSGTWTRCRCGGTFRAPKQTGMSVPEHTCPGCRRAEVAEDKLAALAPPGHVLVGPDARETVARELWEFNRVCEWTEAAEDEKTDYLLGADAVLRAIGVRGGA